MNNSGPSGAWAATAGGSFRHAAKSTSSKSQVRTRPLCLICCAAAAKAGLGGQSADPVRRLGLPRLLSVSLHNAYYRTLHTRGWSREKLLRLPKCRPALVAAEAANLGHHHLAACFAHLAANGLLEGLRASY